MNSAPAEPSLGKSQRGRTAIFANAKGGVGKSTLALMMSLGLATRHPQAQVELIDLDSQATSSDSLRRFANRRFSVRNDDSLFLASGVTEQRQHHQPHRLRAGPQHSQEIHRI
jgi:cellulose biosynthesis protein BcsQ